MLQLTALIFGIPLFLGACTTFLFGRRPLRPSIPGLLFHSVLPKPGAEMSHYPISRFANLCTILRQKSYHSFTISEASGLAAPASGANAILITFDDGLQSVYYHALPVLDRSGFRATVFCVSGFYGDESSWDVFSHNRHLTKEEIRGIARSGHEIGSHTCSHAHLPYLDDQSVRRELSDSKKQLEDIIGKPVTSLSFPYGGWNWRIWEIAKETGYLAATLYRGHVEASEELFPVYGVHQLDSVDDVLSKLETTKPFSLIRARSRMMAHFARGTPIWKYRRNYVRT